MVATVLYYVVLEGTTGRTFGKMVAGTRVVRRSDGGRASLTQLLGRSVARYIPFEPFSVWSSDGMWHDRLSGTRVVVSSPRSGTIAVGP